MGEEKLIHVRLEYSEAVQSKRDILASQANLLRILQTIKRYHPLRMEELKVKTRVHVRMSEILKNIKKLETTLPKIQMPKILQEHHLEAVEEIEDKINKTKERKYDSSLESQLQEIQDRLRELAG